MKFKAGTYYVGDPCYAIPDDDWGDFCNKVFEFEGTGYNPSEGNDLMGDGYGFQFNGEQVWCATTKYGDGAYHDLEGRKYHVDAGLIGVVPMPLIVPEPGTEAVFDPSKPTTIEVDGGHIIEFTEDFEVERLAGSLICIGHIEIETDDTVNEREEDEDWGGTW